MSDVACQNKEMTLKTVVPIFHQICKNYVKHVKHVEKSYWKTDRIIGAKLDGLQIVLEAKDNKDDNDSNYSDSTEEETNE